MSTLSPGVVIETKNKAVDSISLQLEKYCSENPLSHSEINTINKQLNWACKVKPTISMSGDIPATSLGAASVSSETNIDSRAEKGTGRTSPPTWEEANAVWKRHAKSEAEP